MITHMGKEFSINLIKGIIKVSFKMIKVMALVNMFQAMENSNMKVNLKMICKMVLVLKLKLENINTKDIL